MLGLTAYFGRGRYHPLFVFNRGGGLERRALRPDNVASADGWRDVIAELKPASPVCPDGIYEFLEQERLGRAIRLQATLKKSSVLSPIFEA